METAGRNSFPSFAKGLHVLVVDHDKHSLQSIASMLQNYSFKVTTSAEANAALTTIMEEKDEPFNLAMLNATESNMNALSFLHQIGIPIILMPSTESEMKTAEKAIAEWSCHFLEKPISMEDMELVWQIAYRKIRNPRGKNSGENANQVKKSQIGGISDRIVNVAREIEWNNPPIEEEEEEARLKRSAAVLDDDEYLETTKKIMDVEEKKKNSTNKRSRIVWNSKLHRKFTEALSKLGNRKSSPKIILKMMNEPTLTLRQVASHLQKFKSQVKHLNKITASDASNTSLSRSQLQQHLPAKHHSMSNILAQPSFISNLTVPSCFNNDPRLPSQDVVNCHLRIMMNQNNSNPYKPTHPKTHRGFEGTNPVEDNSIFTDELYANESFVQTSHFNFQDCSFLSADYNHYPDAVQEVEFAQNLAAGCLDFENITTSGALSVTAGSLNQNVALKELDDLLNNTEEDPMVYCCYDGEMNSFDIDQYSEWLNA